MSTQIDLPIAGGTVRAAGELVRRYCGMTGETWAYPFYDAVPTSPVVGPVDLLAAGIMHGPIRQEDLEWFVQVRDGMQRLVDALPDDTGLDDADDATVDTLTSGVLDLGDGRPPSLLTNHPSTSAEADRPGRARYRSSLRLCHRWTWSAALPAAGPRRPGGHAAARRS